LPEKQELTVLHYRAYPPELFELWTIGCLQHLKIAPNGWTSSSWLEWPRIQRFGLECRSFDVATAGSEKRHEGTLLRRNFPPMATSKVCVPLDFAGLGRRRIVP
jgi:hypothetical protein